MQYNHTILVGMYSVLTQLWRPFTYNYLKCGVFGAFVWVLFPLNLKLIIIHSKIHIFLPSFSDFDIFTSLLSIKSIKK